MAPVNVVPLIVEPFGPAGTTFGPYTIPGFPMPGHPDYVEGTDISQPLNWWLSFGIGIGTNGASLGSGTPGDRGIVRLQPGETYIIEEGVQFGQKAAANAPPAYVHTDGGAWPWPAPKAHYWKHMLFDLNGSTLHQADPTNYEDGLREKQANCTSGSVTLTLKTALTVGEYNRFVAGGATVQSKITGAGKLFPGNVRGSAISAIDASTRKILTVPAGSLRASTLDEDVVVYLPAIRPERADGVQVVSWSAPGSWNGVERAGMNCDLVFTSLTGWGRVIGSNPDHANGIAGKREGWHALFPRVVDGLEIYHVYFAHHWSDFANQGPASQVDCDDADVDVENLHIHDCYVNGAGRHFDTAQGQYNTLFDRVVARHVIRLGSDNESTAQAARSIRSQKTNCAIGHGTATDHMSPATINGEPPRLISVATVEGEKLVTVEKNMVSSDDRCAFLTGDCFAAGTYMTRRMGHSQIEASEEATDTGTFTVLLGSAVLQRDKVYRQIACTQGPTEHAGNISCPKSKVYLTALLEEGSDVVTDVVFDDRDDGLTFDLSDIASNMDITSVQPSAIPTLNGESGPIRARDITSDSFRMVRVRANGTDVQALAAVTTPEDRTFTISTTAGEKLVTSTSNVWQHADDKGHTVTASTLRPGTVHKAGTGKKATLSVPAESTGTVTATVGGRHRFSANLKEERWTGYEVTDCSDRSPNGWPGHGVWPGNNFQGSLLFPYLQDGIVASRNFLVGNLNGVGATVHHLLSFFTGPTADVVYTQPAWVDDLECEDNRGVNMLDGQAPTPTVTVDLTLTVDDDNSATPEFTVTAEASDARSLDGGFVELYRNGNPTGWGGIVTDENVATIPTFEPYTDGTIHAFTAAWGHPEVGEATWDTLASLSNEVLVHVGGTSDPDATTLGLTADPASGADAGLTVTLTAEIDPDPGIGTVEFLDGAIPLGTVDLAAGVAELDVVFAEGIHNLSAVFDGNEDYAASSDTLTYTAEAVDLGDTTPPVVVTITPPDGTIDVDRHNPGITITFDEVITDLAVRFLDVSTTPSSTITITVHTVDGITWYVTPAPVAGALDAERPHRIVVDDATNEAGLHLTGRVSSNFTTEPFPSTGHAPPELIPTGILVAR